MNKFGNSVTLSTLPQVDPSVLLAPKQFTNIEELEEYFLFNVDYLFIGGSTSVYDKEYYH